MRRHWKTLRTAQAMQRSGLKMDELKLEYPFYAMRMADFLAMKELHTHNELKASGVVVPLDFTGEHEGAHINFVSHQWLDYVVADPEQAHLHTLQDTFTRVIAGESIFKTPEEEEAYHKGMSVANAKVSDHGGRTGGVAESRASFRRSVEEGWVWMDFTSIPQVRS